MIAIDDGIASGNANAADMFFLIGVILGFLAAVLGLIRDDRGADYAPVLAWAAIGCVALGLLLL